MLIGITYFLPAQFLLKKSLMEFKRIDQIRRHRYGTVGNGQCC